MSVSRFVVSCRDAFPLNFLAERPAASLAVRLSPRLNDDFKLGGDVNRSSATPLQCDLGFLVSHGASRFVAPPSSAERIRLPRASNPFR